VHFTAIVQSGWSFSFEKRKFRRRLPRQFLMSSVYNTIYMTIYNESATSNVCTFTGLLAQCTTFICVEQKRREHLISQFMQIYASLNSFQFAFPRVRRYLSASRESRSLSHQRLRSARAIVCVHSHPQARRLFGQPTGVFCWRCTAMPPCGFCYCTASPPPPRPLHLPYLPRYLRR
jgi:hypothetical protein